MSGNAADARAYPHPKVRPEWLDVVQEDILEPELPIVDPHHHLWHDRPSGRYLIEDLAADLASGHNVVATVFMQCGWNHRKDGPEHFRPVSETEAVNAVAVLSATGAYGKARACAGIIGHADLRSDQLQAVLEAHKAAGGGRFRGIRHTSAWNNSIVPTTSTVPPRNLLDDPAFLRGLRLLGAMGLTYDSWQYHPQLTAIARVARGAPDTRMVIDHVGGPLGCGPYRGQRDEVVREWAAGMKELATCPNVYVKLGGLAMPVNGFDYHENARPPASEKIAADWKPWIQPCIEWFGVDRCMFESNFPVDKGMVSYPMLWNAFKRLASGASSAEKAALFKDTATRFYKLDV